MSLAENERRFQELPRCEMQDINGGATAPSIPVIIFKVADWIFRNSIIIV